MALVEFETRKDWIELVEVLVSRICGRNRDASDCVFEGVIYTLCWDMMTIPVSLRIHAIQDFHHVTISWSDVISSSRANKADTPLGFQPDRTRGWLGLC